MFNLRGFECEGLLGAKMQMRQDEQTLHDLSIDSEKAKLKLNGATLRTATATHNGKKHRFWYEIAM